MVEIEIKEGMSIDPKKGIASKTDTVGHVIDSVAVSGGLSKNHQKALKSLNLYGTNKDYELLKAVPIDTFAVSYQYVVYGRDYGWAYRRCTAEEVKKPAKTESYPVTKLYCADETGIAHEIN